MPKSTQFPTFIRYKGQTAYLSIYQAMQQFTDTRGVTTPDELWVLEHFPVYTLGMAGQREHLLDTGNIPVYQVDRGGQVTYHGPGQLVIYTLLNLERRQWHVKKLIHALEQAVIDYLARQHVLGERREKAPGVYVAGRKLASLGLRIRRGCAYHGLSLNIDMDLTLFSGINPCGYAGLEVTQLRALGINTDSTDIATEFLSFLLNTLEIEECIHVKEF